MPPPPPPPTTTTPTTTTATHPSPSDDGSLSPPVIEVPGALDGPPCVEARWLPDRRRFLARDAAGGVELWDAALGSRVRTVLPPLSALTAAVASSTGAGTTGAEETGEDANEEARLTEAERLCWTPAVGAQWAQLDAALGAPRLTLDKNTAFSSELYSLTDLGQEGTPDDLKVNSGAELLRAAAAGWVRGLVSASAAAAAAAAAEEGSEQEVEEAASAAAAKGEEEEEEKVGAGKSGDGNNDDDEEDRAAAATLVSSLRAAEAEAAEAAAAAATAAGAPNPLPPAPPSSGPSSVLPSSVSAFRELEREPSRLLVIAEGADGAGTPLAVPASRIGGAFMAAAAAAAARSGKRRGGEKEKKSPSLIVDARALLPRWSLDAVLHGPPPLPPASTSSSSSSASAASTKMAFVLEPHPRGGGGGGPPLPQLAPRRLSAPKVLALAKVAAHARAKLCEEPHCLELAEEPLACFWDERRQVEAEERAEAEEAETAEKEGGGAANKQQLPRLELCIGEFAAPLDLSLASAREHIWRHVGGGGNGDMVLWYRSVKPGEQRSTRPLLGPE